MFPTTLEAIRSTTSKRTAYISGILALLAVAIVFKAVWLARLGLGHGRDLVDFNAFYITAKLVWLGTVDQAYQFAKLIVIQREVSGGRDGFMPWTYPPQFSLLLAPFALIPVGIAYLLFVASTLTLYLAVLRRLAGDNFVLVLIVFFPTIGITLACGQNSLLTAALIGMVCLFFQERPILAGTALGLMIIKPHLAIAFAVYAVLRRSWIVVMTAAAVVLISSAICTAVFGVEIWSAFLQSVRDSSVFLEHGNYPMHRMISIYAALRTAGLSASAAFVAQGVAAVLALAVVLIAAYRPMPARERFGLVAIVSVCISPYAYDYDFLIFSVGLALLLPALLASAREWERGIIYALPIPIGAFGYLQAMQMASSYNGEQALSTFSIGGFAIIPLIALIVGIVLLRSSGTEAVSEPTVRCASA
ncbi:glycosyltransferase family 87 protein [Bradyrhizobium sp. CER78]|uniref:glycosyltransferase family 87 protein n=1 Tax=Bradyrhizobium sp. CER78 TaxID=3039162 RepID=UPI00244AC0C3|nr:glycosyltransferase family 87 protein [Bradyrhizobium sp. CER78]MDH2385651.1 glycosyltransferase family 87 protein [Bradyrhizobium sp. CER78]